MKVLVIGGNGFIGSNFIKYLINRHPDWEIINYSRSEKKGSLNLLGDLETKPNYKFVMGDLKNTSLIEKLVQEVDYVFNSAGESNIRDFVERPAESINSNLAGIVSLFGATMGSKVKKIVIMTSWEVYGDKVGRIVNESDNLNPENIYASTNAAIENIALGYYKSYGLPVISIRSCNIFGPSQKADKIIPTSISNLLNNKNITLFGDGSDVRAYLYVEDLCKAISLLFDRGRNGEVYNVGFENLISNLDLAKTIAKKMGKTEEFIKFLPDKKTYNLRIKLNLDKIISLGWKPETSFENGIERTINWYLKNQLISNSTC